MGIEKKGREGEETKREGRGIKRVLEISKPLIFLHAISEECPNNRLGQV